MGQTEDSTLQVCQLTDKRSSKAKSGKIAQTDSGVSVRRFCQNKLGKHCREWPAGKTESEIKLLIQEKQQTGRPHSVCTLKAQSPKTSQDGASLSSKVRTPSMKTVQPIRYQPPV